MLLLIPISPALIHLDGKWQERKDNQTVLPSSLCGSFTVVQTRHSTALIELDWQWLSALSEIFRSLPYEYNVST